MVKFILIKSPDEWATTKQACRDELAVYLFFFSPIYTSLYFYVLSTVLRTSSFTLYIFIYIHTNVGYAVFVWWMMIFRRLDTLCSLLGKLCAAGESRQKRTRRGRVHKIGQLCGRVLLLASKPVKIKYRTPPCICRFTGWRYGCCYRYGTEKGRKPTLFNSVWDLTYGGIVVKWSERWTQ